jgi:hypothetical protein
VYIIIAAARNAQRARAGILESRFKTSGGIRSIQEYEFQYLQDTLFFFIELTNFPPREESSSGCGRKFRAAKGLTSPVLRLAIYGHPDLLFWMVTRSDAFPRTRVRVPCSHLECAERR